ncbi:hypothetical protein PMG11_06484 [Penicillium brasilianum]|uniref:Something about silencing protein 4 domain-containing protein n=1 Tax=Penicillium brasilianum TaxID=104259 RepID=A0A0F7TQT0_PENBI|nr:hypothetical protein PMG11_06484 [Penicillium brasilianum]
MAVLSRSSLRGSMRRIPNDHLDYDRQGPPMKRQRTLHDLWPVNRRRSSPDCLDATTPTHDPAPSKARHALPPAKPTRPRSVARRTRRTSASSVDSVSLGDQLTTPATPRVYGNGVTTLRRVSDREIPAGTRSATDLLRDEPESPDPLDTISPVVTANTVKTRPGVYARSAESEKKLSRSPAATRSSWRVGHDAKPEQADTMQSTVESEAVNAMRVQSPDVRPADATRSQQQQQVETEHDASAPTGNERRSLRSADTGSRCKSELAQYFHNYEQIISLDDPKPELLAFNTIVTLIDDLPEPLPSLSSDPSPFGNPLQKLYNCEVVTLPEPASSTAGIDPLNEDLYFRAHRKFERQEKQLRNIERDRAQHEKQHVDRLLEELRSQDWLRVMGLTGIHENEKKLYEPKRQILIEELVALVNKFQVWKDEERRRKLLKEKHLPTGEAETDAHGPRQSRKQSRPVEDAAEESSPLPDTPSTPDPNDVDAWAARQLHQEARSASVAKRRKSVSENRKSKAGRAEADHSTTTEIKPNSKKQKPQQPPPSSVATSPPPPPPAPFVYPLPPDKPFTSFFEQPHHRELALAAVNGTRRGRTHTILAFGHPMPDMSERDFEPPEEILTDEAIYASQRQRRLLKRRSRG